MSYILNFYRDSNKTDLFKSVEGIELKSQKVVRGFGSRTTYWVEIQDGSDSRTPVILDYTPGENMKEDNSFTSDGSYIAKFKYNSDEDRYYIEVKDTTDKLTDALDGMCYLIYYNEDSGEEETLWTSKFVANTGFGESGMHGVTGDTIYESINQILRGEKLPVYFRVGREEYNGLNVAVAETEEFSEFPE